MIRKITLFKLCLAALIFINAKKSLSQEKKERVGFASTYFELGGSLYPSFTGKSLVNNQETSFSAPGSFNPVLSWGGFHFWGKAEFFVSFPLKRFLLSDPGDVEADFTHSTVTGARFYPWRVQKKKLRPYVGLSWSAFDFKQKNKDDDLFPNISKPFELGIDAGLIYIHDKIGFRLSGNYFLDNNWKYPISKTKFADIKTPNYGLNFSLIYTYESSGKPKESEEWNEFPTLSKLSYGTKSFGDFFIAAGPSSSFSLETAEYNNNNLSYLDPKTTATVFLDFAIGYQFNEWNMFTALSVRNPGFVRKGFGMEQSIKKTSVALEVNKFLTDYTGFAPFAGVNLAYDKIDYKESLEGETIKELTSYNIEPGISFGWDIVPGKTNEALILRTNLRWYPLSSFDVSGEKFNFSQLEYNFIQAVFYPGRYQKGKKRKK